MSRVNYIGLFVLLFLVGFVSSDILVTPLGGDISEGETFVGMAGSGIISNIKAEDIKVLWKGREMPFDKGIYFHNGSLFFYVTFPKSGDYTIESPYWSYLSNGSLLFGRMEYGLSVGISTGNSMTLSPGILFGQNPSLNLINVGKNNLTIKVSGESISLEEGSSKIVSIEPKEEFYYLDVSSYKNFKIPVFPSLSNGSDIEDMVNDSIGNSSNNSSLIEGNDSIKLISSFNLYPLYLEKNFTTRDNHTLEFVLENELNESIIVNVVSLNNYFKFNNSVSLEPFEQKEFEIEFFSEDEGIFEAEFFFSSGEFSLNSSVSIIALESEDDFDSFFENELDDEGPSCLDLGGIACLPNYQCKGGSIRSMSGGIICCIGGSCVSENEEPEAPKKTYFIGILAVLLAGGVGYYFYNRMKNVKPKAKL